MAKSELTRVSKVIQTELGWNLYWWPHLEFSKVCEILQLGQVHSHFSCTYKTSFNVTVSPVSSVKIGISSWVTVGLN